jgi:hypothetical protein
MIGIPPNYSTACVKSRGKDTWLEKSTGKAVNLRSIPKFGPEIAQKVWRCPIDTENFELFTQNLA